MYKQAAIYLPCLAIWNFDLQYNLWLYDLYDLVLVSMNNKQIFIVLENILCDVSWHWNVNNTALSDKKFWGKYAHEFVNQSFI